MCWRRGGSDIRTGLSPACTFLSPAMTMRRGYRLNSSRLLSPGPGLASGAESGTLHGAEGTCCLYAAALNGYLQNLLLRDHHFETHWTTAAVCQLLPDLPCEFLLSNSFLLPLCLSFFLLLSLFAQVESVRLSRSLMEKKDLVHFPPFFFCLFRKRFCLKETDSYFSITSIGTGKLLWLPYISINSNN